MPFWLHPGTKELLAALKAALFQFLDPFDRSGEQKNGKFKNSPVHKKLHGLRGI